MSIKIEKNVPITDGRGREFKYPFSEMNVNDSFIVFSENHEGQQKLQHSVKGSYNHFITNHQPDWKFKTKKEGAKGVRVWRTK